MVGGWGINDAGYTTVTNVNGKTTWLCPAYRDWSDLIKRVYSEKYHIKNPSYIKTTICEEWKYFSNFKKWVDCQPNKNWRDCVLDKDLLVKGNTRYSPETCIYIEKRINLFIVNCLKTKGSYLMGVYWNKSLKRFQAQCRNPFTRKKECVGIYDCEVVAHEAWRSRKHEFACQLADLQEDVRAGDALRTFFK